MPKNIFIVYCLSLVVMCLTKTNGPNNSIYVYVCLHCKGIRRRYQKVKRVFIYIIYFFYIYSLTTCKMLLAIVHARSWIVFFHIFASKKKIMKNEPKKTQTIFNTQTHTSFEAYINWWPLQWPCAWMRTLSIKERRSRRRRWLKSGANVYFWFGQMKIFTRELCDFFFSIWPYNIHKTGYAHIIQVRRMIYEKWTA